MKIISCGEISIVELQNSQVCVSQCHHSRFGALSLEMVRYIRMYVVQHILKKKLPRACVYM